jgi:hypothetical protein
MPKRIVILRHGEKHGELSLSAKGYARAKALAQNFLGNNARHPLFKKPSAFLALSFHTVETATPSAQSWELPVIAFSTSPGLSEPAKNKLFDTRTRQAAKDAMRRDGTVVMIWEHHRIADARLPQERTLRHLLDLERLDDKVPMTWPDDDYDSIWVIGYGKHGQPKSFEAHTQNFRMRTAGPKQRKPRRAPSRLDRTGPVRSRG